MHEFKNNEHKIKAMHYKTIPFLFLFLCLSVLPKNSFAADYFLQANSVFTTPIVNSVDRFFFNVTPDRSYCIESLTTTGTSLAFINALSTVDMNFDIVNSNRGEASAPVYPFFVPNLTPLARRCFITVGNFQNISSYRLQAALGFTGDNLGIGVLIQLNETTLVGGYNTSVTNYNFLELTNTLVKASHDTGVIAGKYTIKNSITNQVVTTQSFTVNPQDRIDISIHDLVGAGSFGTITLLHNGPAGSLKGIVSQYRIISSNPFRIKPVLQEPLLRTNGLP